MPEQESGRKLRVIVSGSSGLIGSVLVSDLSAHGHQVVRLVRRQPAVGRQEFAWDVNRGVIDPDALQGADAVINLAGESIADGRWTAAKKARILHSRVASLGLLARTMAQMERPPQVLISASAIGYYGDRGDELLTEDSPGGRGFLHDVCEQWEASAEPAAAAGIRVVCTRFGIVLSQPGGALNKLLPLFRAGLGGRLGSGQQCWSWVALDDVVGALGHALATPSLAGPVNVVAPEPVTNAAFTTVLARALQRPALLLVPSFALRLLLGQMADEMLLASQRVKPKRLAESGYQFRYPDLTTALAYLLSTRGTSDEARMREGRHNNPGQQP